MHMEEYLSQPIPNLDAVREQKKGYRQHAIDIANERYTEELIDVRTLGIAGVNHYFSSENPPYNQHIPGSIEKLLVRTTVGAKLVAVNEQLRPLGLELFVFDALRPLAIQNYFHDTWFPELLRTKYPHWTDEQIKEEVSQYWAYGGNEIDPLSPPPHATGGALDLTIRYINGQQLWMGTLFDDVTAEAHTDALENETELLSLSREEAKKNRRILYWAMTQEGFVNNPTEWWHFSFGDQMWARLSGVQHALYSVAPSEGKQ